MDTSKWVYALMSAVLFLVFASPFAFYSTQKLIGDYLGFAFVKNGTPTTLGLLIHGALFGLVVRLLMG